MWNYIYPNELYHHGIKGQKWGVRRFQNADGSLTKLGQQRYYSDNERKDIASKARKKVSVMSGLDRDSRYSYVVKGVDEFREAGQFLKEQKGVVKKNFNAYHESVQKDLTSLISDKKFIDECKEEMKKSLNGNYDEHDIELAAFYAIDARKYKYESPETKKAFEKFDNSAIDYRDNVTSITEDIVGKYGDNTVASYRNKYGKQKVSYRDVTHNTLRDLGDGIVVDWLQANPELAYYNDTGLSPALRKLVTAIRDDYKNN